MKRKRDLSSVNRKSVISPVKKKSVISPFEFEGLVSFEEIKSYKTLNGRHIEGYQTADRRNDKESVKLNKKKTDSKFNEQPLVNDSTNLKTLKKKKQKSLKRKNAKTNKNSSSAEHEKRKKPFKRKDAKLNKTSSTPAEHETKDVDTEAWRSIFTPDLVIEAIQELGFKEPTSIQKLTIPAAIQGRKDIIGAAETGSGKTLAFIIPIIHGILRQREEEEENDDSEGSEEESECNLDEDECEMSEKDTERDNECEIGSETDDDDSDVEIEGDTERGECESDEESEGESELSDMERGHCESDDMYGGQCESDEESEGESELSDMERGHCESDESVCDEEKLGCVKVIKNIKFDSDVPKSKHNYIKTPSNKKLRALIVTPTRELAVQIKKHTDAVLAKTDIKSAIVIGGLAQVKQDRVLKKCPEIIIGTPGRLWELVKQGNEHLNRLPKIRYLVIDETDRMLERGHFFELKQLMGLINSGKDSRNKRQNFVFSATLTLVRAPSKKPNQKKKKGEVTREMKLDHFAKFVGVRENKRKIVDLTRQFGTAEMLSETKIFCEREEKDIFMYYFLRRFPARTLVFCNSISCVKRLNAVLTILQCNPYSLHAMKQQRQRLKNLDRFTATPVSVLLATDVAARGLDIPGVDHIIHYDVPYTAEMYVHRSGRTARANKEGISVLLIDSQEVNKYRQLCSTLNRTSDLTSFPVDEGVLQSLTKCVKLAKEIESMQRQHKNKRSNDKWIERSAQEAGLLLGDSDESDDERDYEDIIKQKRAFAELYDKKARLNSLLSQPLCTKMLSQKFPTYTGALNLAEQMNIGSMLAPALNIMKKKKQEKLIPPNLGDKQVTKVKKKRKKFYKPLT